MKSFKEKVEILRSAVLSNRRAKEREKSDI